MYCHVVLLRTYSYSLSTLFFLRLLLYTLIVEQIMAHTCLHWLLVQTATKHLQQATYLIQQQCTQPV